MDDDADGFSECLGDCADSLSSVFPAAPQLCGDGLNNDCSSSAWPSLTGTNESDDDGDLRTECAGDCNDMDAGALAAPVVVDGLDVSAIPGGQRYAWTDQSSSAGAGTVYDVFWGSIRMLGSSGDYSTGICRVENISGASFDDTGIDPPAGDAFYFLFRAQNSCGTASWGTMNRDTTAASSTSRCL